MIEKLKEFYELLSAKPELCERLKDETMAAAIALAAEYGITLTQADFGAGECELDDDELNAVAGGAACMCMSGGTGDGNEGAAHSCSCPLNGLGELFSEGEDGSVTSSVRCWCASVGNGTDDGGLFADDWMPKW